MIKVRKYFSLVRLHTTYQTFHGNDAYSYSCMNGLCFPIVSCHGSLVVCEHTSLLRDYLILLTDPVAGFSVPHFFESDNGEAGPENHWHVYSSRF